MEHGSLGRLELVAGGRLSNDGLPEQANAALFEATAAFIQLDEHRTIALWNHGEGPPAVVLHDDDDQEHRTLAPTLETFLDVWSKRKTGTVLDARYDDALPTLRHAELAAWLHAQKVKLSTRKAPDFARWMRRLAIAMTDAPATPSGVPPKDMAARAIASLGKGPRDPKLAALLAELGIDFKKYKTAAMQRDLAVPEHGFSLQFNGKKLCYVIFANKGVEVFDAARRTWVRCEAYPHLICGVKMTDRLAIAKKKLGKPTDPRDDESFLSYPIPGGRLCLSWVTRQAKGGPAPGEIEMLKLYHRPSR
jgi:hypothetical protein